MPDVFTIAILAAIVRTAAMIPMTAIAVGLLLASLLFLNRKAEVADVKEWTYLDDYEEGKDNRSLKPVPAHTMVFEITGPHVLCRRR